MTDGASNPDTSGPTRSIELEVEVTGTPEQVWEAIATGPGITSWYVPHEVEEREGGAALASFGPGPEMQVAGRVAAWEPPRRVVFDGGEDAGGMAFEWLVEARGAGTCVVRLVNSGFGEGDEWDDQYDAMTEGWLLFLANLGLHMEHFAGRQATASIPIAQWPGTLDQAWERLRSGLGIQSTPDPGDRVVLAAGDGPSLAGVVVESGSHHLLLLVDDPAPGTAFAAAEGAQDALMVSVWSYLYGAEGAAAAERDQPAWSDWLHSRGETGT